MKLLQKADQYYQTISRLRWEQVFYSAASKLFPKKKLRQPAAKNISFKKLPIQFIPTQKPVLQIKNGQYQIHLLNRKKTYSNTIDWSDETSGRLWNYHLQYAEFLLQQQPGNQVKSDLICQIYDQLFAGHVKPEPYPASLRSMNVIKWLSHFDQAGIQSIEKIKTGLYSELEFVYNNPEYHLLGNHLLENAFALLMGGHFMGQQHWINQAEKILQKELDEQFLNDGAHFERSVMYHQQILARLLEAVFYLPGESALSRKMRPISATMFSWLENMTFRNGDVANFNDCTYESKKENRGLTQLAEIVGVDTTKKMPLQSSGFRKLSNTNFEIIATIGGINPEYLPAHSHADTFSFIMHINGKPVVADPGISVYTPGERRNHERSTRAHNTVTREGLNTADVWESFRIGRRPEVAITRDESTEIEASLASKPFSGRVFNHSRQFHLSDNVFEINDAVSGSEMVSGRINLHPGVEVQRQSETLLVLTGGTRLRFNGIRNVETEEYFFNESWNKQTPSVSIIYHFEGSCTVRFEAARS